MVYVSHHGWCKQRNIWLHSMTPRKRIKRQSKATSRAYKKEGVLCCSEAFKICVFLGSPGNQGLPTTDSTCMQSRFRQGCLLCETMFAVSALYSSLKQNMATDRKCVLADVKSVANCAKDCLLTSRFVARGSEARPICRFRREQACDEGALSFSSSLVLRCRCM